MVCPISNGQFPARKQMAASRKLCSLKVCNLMLCSLTLCGLLSGLTHFERTTCTGRKQMVAKRKLNCLCFTVFIHKGWQRILSYFYAIDVFFRSVV